MGHLKPRTNQFLPERWIHANVVSWRLSVNGHVKMDTNGHEKSPRLAKK